MKINQVNKNSISLSKMIPFATLNQLNCGLHNIKGGKNHIITLIGKNYFHELLKEGKIHQHDSYLYADIEEKSGNAIRRAITVVTSSLGIWMGLADFLGNGHRSWRQLIWVSVITIFMSILISFMSYHFAAKRAKAAVLQKKLLNLQDVFLTHMVEKMGKKLLRAREILCHSLLKLDDNFVISNYISFFDEKDKEKTSKRGKEILTNLRKKMKTELDLLASNNPLYHYLFNDIFKQLKKIIIEKMRNITTECAPLSTEDKREKNNPKLLFRFPTHYSKNKMTFISWLMDSSLSIFLEAVPVFIGTFSAFFLFLNGLPDTFKKLGYDDIISSLNLFWVKFGSLSLTILFVLYLGISQIKFSYKSYLRTKNIEDSRDKIAMKETQYSILHRQYMLINNFSKTLIKLLNMLDLSQADKK